MKRHHHELNIGCTQFFPGPIDEVQAFLWDFHNLERYIPHVLEVRNLEGPGTDAASQLLQMTMRTDIGSRITIVTERKLEHHLICYQQRKLPPFLRSHSGQWLLCEDGSDTLVYLNHKIGIDYEAACRFFETEVPDEIFAKAGDLVKRAGIRSLEGLKSGWMQELNALKRA